MKNKMVHVFWVDSMSRQGWVDHKPSISLKCESVGFMLEKNKERIVLAKSYSHGEHAVSWGDHMHIPMCAVTKIRVLK